jgi:hypothetical protein
LEEWVALDLADGRLDLVVVDGVDKQVGVEVRDADRADLTAAVHLLHRAPGTAVVAERLVDQVQVEVFSRAGEGAGHSLLAANLFRLTLTHLSPRNLMARRW